MGGQVGLARGRAADRRRRGAVPPGACRRSWPAVAAIVDEQAPARPAPTSRRRAPRPGPRAPGASSSSVPSGSRHLTAGSGKRRGARRQRRSRTGHRPSTADQPLVPAARCGGRTGGSAGRPGTRWRAAAAAGRRARSGQLVVPVDGQSRQSRSACRSRRTGLVSTRWIDIAASRNAGTTCAARSASAISVPRPGPSSTSAHRGAGGRVSSQCCTSGSPSSSPNSWLISGAVTKSPAAPKGSRRG